MEELKDVIDLNLLENEVKEAIEGERLYFLQNSAKIRAVTEDKVGSYEEFRDRVNAAHLRPLERKDREREVKPKRREMSAEQIWEDADAQTIQERLTRLTRKEERYEYLKEFGLDELGRGRREVPVGVLGDIIEALSAFPNTTEDVLFVVSILEALAKTERFRLGLDFLTCSEKDVLSSLVDRLSKSFTNRHQDLAEQGVTEWTLEGIKDKYRVLKKPQE